MTTKVGFDPKSPCRKLWEDLWDDGKLTNHVGKLVENHRDGMRLFLNYRFTVLVLHFTAD